MGRRPATATALRLLATPLAAMALGLVATPLAAMALGLLTPVAAEAQTATISGVVRDASTDGPVSGTRVRLVGSAGVTTASTLTDGEGRFRLERIQAGTYGVHFQRLNFADVERHSVTVAAGQTLTMDVSLDRRAFDAGEIVVSVGGGREERRVEAPAAVEIVDRQTVRERPAITVADQVKGVVGVDDIPTGLQSGWVTVRGFNNIFSGATLTLTDWRIASVPSLRANVHHMNPVTNEDIERVEVVLGPGSAVYGPNAANGVIHLITTSPLDQPGLSFSVASGARQQARDETHVLKLDSVVTLSSSTEPVTHLQGRYAATVGQRLGFKVSGQYFAGEEWGFTDVVEAEHRVLAQACRDAGYQVNHAACQNFSEGLDFSRPRDVETLRTSVDNVARGRDNAIRRYSADLRADWRPADDLTLVLSGGRSTNVNSIDLTGLGAAQVIDWNSDYVQARAMYRDAFAQVFLNRSGNTDTYLLRSGRPLYDESTLFATQLKNTSRLGEGRSLTYGADLLRTVPRTRGTINGRNEDDDDMTEVGAYVQGQAPLSPRFDLVAAARVDTHDRLEDPVFSPRVALMYRPGRDQNLRLTYNKAFSTPTTLNLFLDLSGDRVPLGGPFRYDVRAQGTTEHGMTFRRTEGIPDFMTPFGLLVDRGPRTLRPTTTENLWEVAVAVVSASNPEAGALLRSLPVPSGDQVGIDLRLVNLEAGASDSPFKPAPYTLAGMGDIDRLRPTITNTLEAGYSGLIAERLQLGANVYRTRIDDFTSALRVNSPNVFLNRADLADYLEGFGVPQSEAAALARSIGGEGEHGSRAAPGIPLGVITPEQAGGTESAIVLTFENLGRVDLWGADFSATLHLDDAWAVTANAAWVSDDRFEAGGEFVPLNAPTLKGATAVRYRDRARGISGQLRARHVGGFPANSAVYAGQVDAYTIFDLNVGYEFSRMPGVSVRLDVQDLFDTGYRSFVGAPRLGRFALLRLRYEM